MVMRLWFSAWWILAEVWGIECSFQWIYRTLRHLAGTVTRSLAFGALHPEPESGFGEQGWWAYKGSLL